MGCKIKAKYSLFTLNYKRQAKVNTGYDADVSQTLQSSSPCKGKWLPGLSEEGFFKL